MNARQILELRARVRAVVRGLFEARGFLEVDTPVLSGEVLPEAHIDPLTVPIDAAGGRLFLQASPEAHMKRLLARGSGAIFQFARAFRAGERGSRHDVEFVLLEWYAPGTRADEAADLLERLCSLTLGTEGLERVGCAEAFGRHAGVDPLAASLAEMEAAVARAGLVPPATVAALGDAARWDRAFERLLAEVVQPALGHERPTLLEDWPVSQAAFARIADDGPPRARRFELFVAGVELANGWEEETARAVLAERIASANRERVADGRPPLPAPERLLEAHGDAMPEGVGAALGFDRLVMLAAGCDSIDAVRCFDSGTA